MKQITILFLLLMQFPLSWAESVPYVINISRFEYIRDGKECYVCTIEIKNNGNENMWFWFDERKQKLTNREIAEYFYRKPSDASAMSLVEQALDGNVEGLPALFATFIKQIIPNSSFIINLFSSEPIDESLWLDYIQVHSTSRIFHIKNHLSLLDTSFYPFYQGNSITINAEISDSFNNHTHLNCKRMHIQDPDSYE